MEQKSPPMAKKVSSLIRVMFFMLKKDISNIKFFANLNIVIQRGKIAGKSIHNLLFHHSLFSNNKKHQNKHRYLPTPHAPPSADDIDDVICINSELLKALEMLTSVTGSPAMMGSGKCPMVRVTDSPFPVSNGEEGGEVDEDAEKFILRFYNGLTRQN